jgi:hypothetical protein
VTHLILHKVRGEPAFDVAQQIAVNGELWWIIPTSGHRAYPYKTWNLEDLHDTSDINRFGYHSTPVKFEDKVPPDWPDHYQVGAKQDGSSEHPRSVPAAARKSAVTPTPTLDDLD